MSQIEQFPGGPWPASGYQMPLWSQLWNNNSLAGSAKDKMLSLLVSGLTDAVCESFVYLRDWVLPGLEVNY